MKHLDLVCAKADRDATLEGLRRLGAVHLDLSAAHGAAVGAADEAMAAAEKAVRLVRKARGKTPRTEFELRPRTVAEVLKLDEDRSRLEAERDRLEREIRRYEPYGDFDPELAKKLLEKVDGLADRLELPPTLPEMRLSKMREKLARTEDAIAVDDAKLSGVDELSIVARYPALRDRLAFEQAKELLADRGALAVISGWIPEPRVAELEAKVREQGWGVLLREPAADEVPPTLVEPPRLFRPVKALFDGLGISPGYTEGDVSVAFMCYFSLFFAMLVGDGAYGLIFLGATVFGWWRFRKAPAAARSAVAKSWLVLMTVFSLATVGWGLLSNTWFGAQIPWCRDWPTVKWLADPSYNHMMLLCFTIGVSHLTLARVWNGVLKINSPDCLAEFGWAGVLLFMYLVTNTVVGIFPAIPTWGYWMFGASLAMVASRTRGAALGMLPLNVMSSLGDIISYVRLFAVGLASVKVAENFNSMATGLLAGGDAWYLKALLAVAMVAILVIGHALNLAMAGLSILVHAVRLNTLEFSNHKGVSWSGYAFRAFARNAK